MAVYELDGVAPKLADDVYIAPNAQVMGNVKCWPEVRFGSARFYAGIMI